MLTTARAIVIAGVLVAVGLVLHGLLPQYELHSLPAGAFAQFDRWTGHVRFSTLSADADWLTQEKQRTR